MAASGGPPQASSGNVALRANSGKPSCVSVASRSAIGKHLLGARVAIVSWHSVHGRQTLATISQLWSLTDAVISFEFSYRFRTCTFRFEPNAPSHSSGIRRGCGECDTASVKRLSSAVIFMMAWLANGRNNARRCIFGKKKAGNFLLADHWSEMR